MEISSQSSEELTLAELECERHFQDTHYRDDSGRYVVRLPLYASITDLGTSFHVAKSCLNRLERKLFQDSLYRQLYMDFLAEYESI